ncbi:hypothetical protein [Streptomyces sp. NPDC003483]
MLAEPLPLVVPCHVAEGGVEAGRDNPHRGETGVFNGSSGTITALDPEAHQLAVTFTDGETATYPSTDLDDWSTPTP